MKTIPFDLEKFKAGAVAMCRESSCSYLGTTRDGRIVTEWKDGNLATFSLTQLYAAWSLLAEPEYVPLTMDDLLAMDRLPLVRYKKGTTAYAIYEVGEALVKFHGSSTSYEDAMATVEMYINGKWVPMRKEKV